MSEKLYEEMMDLAAGLHLTGKITHGVYEMLSEIEETDTARLERVTQSLKKMEAGEDECGSSE